VAREVEGNVLSVGTRQQMESYELMKRRIKKLSALLFVRMFFNGDRSSLSNLLDSGKHVFDLFKLRLGARRLCEYLSKDIAQSSCRFNRSIPAVAGDWVELLIISIT
jgi:hypothetical protein